MKDTIKNLLTLFLSAFFIVSCNTDEENNIFIDSRAREIEEALEFLKSQSKIQNAYLENSKTTKVIINNEQFVLRINGLNIETYDSRGNKIVESQFEKNSNAFLMTNVVYYPLNDSEKDFSFKTMDNPEHDGQDFCECYKNDLEEFCDGLIGCAALLHPLVQAVIISHCVIETGSTKCKDK